MIKAVLCIDEAVGETRRCLVDGKDRPFRLEIDRASERGKRVKLGERRWVRAVARMAGENDWFAASDGDDGGVLQLPAKHRITEGQLIPVVVAAEAFADKGPRYRLDKDLAGLEAQKPANPALHAAPVDDPFLSGIELTSRKTGQEARDVIDDAIEEGLQTVVPIPSGGDLAIEPTRALTAIDVDTGGAAAKSVPDFNKLAAREAARQIGLRGAAGLVVVDFVSMPLRDDRARVVDSFRSALVEWGVEFAGVSAVSMAGLCEAIIVRKLRPLADAIRAPGGEREALDALRAIETAAMSAPGKRIRARIGAASEAWLASGAVDWEPALAGRIGRRWIIEPGVAPRGPRPEVWAES